MLQVYLQLKPRAIYLLTTDAESSNVNGQKGGTALLLTTQNNASASTSTASSHRAVVETVDPQDVPSLNTLQKLQARAYGCLGLINVGSGECRTTTFL